MSPLGTNYYSHQVPVGGGGGVITILQSPWGGGGGREKENQANFIGHNKNCPTPLPFLGDKEWIFYCHWSSWPASSLHPPPTQSPNSSPFMERYTDRSSLPNVRVEALLGLPLRREHQCVMSADSCAVVIWNVMQCMVSCEIRKLST